MSVQPTPQHPGAHLAYQLERRGWHQVDLAFILGTSPSTVNNLISGRKIFTAPISKALAEAFGFPPDHFLILQSQYNLSIAEELPIDLQRRAQLQRQYPLREMIRRGWIEGDEEGGPSLEDRVTRFFGVNSIDEVPHIGHAAKKTGDESDIPATQLAWLFRVCRLAEEMAVQPYSRQRLSDSIDEMRSFLVAPSEIRRVPKLLADAGVRLVIVEGLPGGKIDGVCTWLDNQNPVIAMSLRFDRIDNFWFVLRHELEHVLNCDGQKRPIVDEDIDPVATDIPAEELRANEAAADFCVPAKKMDSFYRRKYPLFSRRDVQAFAQINQTHPGLVVGQLQHRTQKWSFLREMQVKVRHIITTTALSDGWGNVIPVYL